MDMEAKGENSVRGHPLEGRFVRDLRVLGRVVNVIDESQTDGGVDRWGIESKTSGESVEVAVCAEVRHSPESGARQVVFKIISRVIKEGATRRASHRRHAAEDTGAGARFTEPGRGGPGISPRFQNSLPDELRQSLEERSDHLLELDLRRQLESEGTELLEAAG